MDGGVVVLEGKQTAKPSVRSKTSLHEGRPLPSRPIGYERPQHVGFDDLDTAAAK
jgi:hypothetical protein